MGDVNRGDTGLACDSADKLVHVITGLFVERAEGFVETQDGGLRRQGPSQGHPLSLPSAQSVEAAIQQPGDSQPPGQVLDPGIDLALGSTPDLQGEADLVADHHRLEQGSLLGNKSDSTGPGFQTRDIPAIDDNPSRADRFQTTQGFQQCRLATAGTSHQDPVLTDLQ